ncbi:unnamed protein product [Nesidiocoris tenuis]|uniref:alpha-glucosidase n=1 Tax=Nesidiocoris tenuis TaxID=355587 RepID=A0A6H5GZ71_9HEMI|nr:unnamed protein product [Nesidiocoris tenuis]
MDFVPNHTSDKHPWFNASVYEDTAYKDYYVWHDPNSIVVNNTSTLSPPNNWISNFDGSMWTYHPQRKQYYLHQFLKEQPDLNYRHPPVVQAMKDVLTFWLDKGIYGFRMDAVFAIIESQTWQNEPYIGGPVDAYSSYDHTMTAEQPETFDILSQFRQHIDAHTSNGPPAKIMMTESYNSNYQDVQKYYGTQTNPISTFPFNFFWIQNGTLETTAAQWAGLINDWYSKVMPGPWAQPNFVLGNHDKNRFASRLTPQHTDVMNMLQIMLNGTAVVYFGDEIGLQDAIVRPDQAVDPVTPSRDPERAPMAWNNTNNGGFTTGEPWLPLASQYWNVNADAQRNTNDSHLQVFKDLIKLRKSNNMTMRSCEVESAGNSLIIYRALRDHPTIISVINLGNLQETVDLTKSRSSLPFSLPLMASTLNYKVIAAAENRTLTSVDTNSVTLPPLSGVVLKTF